VIWLRDFAAIAAFIALITGALAIVLNDRRWMLLMLAGEYVALTWLSATILPLQTAAVKLVAGIALCEWAMRVKSLNGKDSRQELPSK